MRVSRRSGGVDSHGRKGLCGVELEAQGIDSFRVMCAVNP
jgi:hypothetical protein